MAQKAAGGGRNSQRPSTVALYGLLNTKPNIILLQFLTKYYIVNVYRAHS